MEDLDYKAKTEKELNRLKAEVYVMDKAVMAYFKDPAFYLSKISRVPPQYEELAKKIKHYTFSDTSSRRLELILESVQFTLYHHMKSWLQWKQDADGKKPDRRHEKHFCAPSEPDPHDGQKSKKGRYNLKTLRTLNMLWEMQLAKLLEHSHNEDDHYKEPESRPQFEERILKEYKTLKNLYGDKEKPHLAFVYDKDKELCKLIAEARDYESADRSIDSMLGDAAIPIKPNI
jgi:hypothetical protein